VKKPYFLLVFVLTIGSTAYAQVGIGTGGGLFYPGISESAQYGSRFVTGAGYEFFTRHRLLTLSTNLTLHAKYTYQFYYSDIDLPFTGGTRFTFNYLTIAVFSPVIKGKSVQLTAGGGMGLVIVNASKDLLSVTETVLVPHLQIGVEKMLGNFFNLYVEMLFQFGSFPVRDDNLSINGMRVMAGITMFLTE
jgi:hypothetical protein